MIRGAIADYHRLTCIRFVPYNGQSKNFLAITNKNTGCWSSVGMINNGRQELNLQAPGCLTTKGTPIHELLHALGHYHEQSRPDRNKYVVINTGNIKSCQYDKTFKKKKL
jgi:hypothetical protein